MLKDTSVVICNKNSLKYLKKTIPIIKKVKFKEIFVVDGNSTDGSINFLKSEKIKVVSDKNKGLTFARKIGSKNSKGKYIFFLGPDDLCNHFFFNSFSKNFQNQKFDAVTPLLKIKKIKTYWDSGLNFFLSNIRKPGPTKVIGTPTLFKKKLFRHIQYNINLDGCDDTYISEELLKKGFKIGVLNVFCHQANDNKLNDIYKKFILYGKSDINYYKIKKKEFSIYRTIYSFLKPFDQFLDFCIIVITKNKYKYIPFIVLMTIFRYIGIIKSI